MVRAVLVGCGAMSEAWLGPARETGVELAGLVDIDPDRARQRARQFDLDGVAIGTDLDAMLAQTKPDVVFDVVVPSARREIVLTALRHGCHVLTEKPLAASPEDARAIVAAARDAGRIHAVIQNRRYLAEPRRIRRFVASGAIGAPTSIHCDFFVPPHFGGFREEMDHVLLLDMAIHTFDSARFLVDRQAPRRLLPRMGAGRLLVPPGLLRRRHLRHERERRLHLRRQLVRRRPPHQLGERLAHRRRERHADLGRLRRHPRRGAQQRPRGPLRQRRAGGGAAARSR